MAILLIIIIFCSVPLYSLIKMVISFRKSAPLQTVDGRSNAAELFYILFILCILFFGFIFNTFGVPGGEALKVYEVTDAPLGGYAPLSNKQLPSIWFLFWLGIGAYYLLSAKARKLSPILYVLCSVLLILNILFTIIYLTHTGFSYFNNSLDVLLSILLLQVGYISLSFLYVAKLNDSMKYYLHTQLTEDVKDKNKFLKILRSMSRSYKEMSILWMIFLFPVFIIIQLIMTLFGQRPDSFIQALIETSSFNYSQLPEPPEKIYIPGDGHYLCTVSATGHRQLVKPMRACIRHGSRIIVNRQLLVANAFENILEEYVPKTHKRIRLFYDTYGYPISRHIQTKWSADIVYLLMKPAEWVFLLVLYTVRRKIRKSNSYSIQ